MKALYFDSSYLFRIYSQEPGHEAVKSLLESVSGVVSGWHARAEFAAILLRKRRERAALPESLDSLHAQFHQDRADGLVQLAPLDEAVMIRLESVLQNAPDGVFLRAADALHLSCAAERGFKEVYSNDRHFLAAAPLFGLQGVDVIEP